MKKINYVVFLGIALGLVACGGGSSGGTTTTSGNPISTDAVQQQSQMGTAALGTARLQ